MGKCKNAAKGGVGTQKGASSTLSSHGGDPGNTVPDLMEEVASLEKELLQMGASSKMSFNSHDPVDHCPNNLYHLSIDVRPQ